MKSLHNWVWNEILHHVRIYYKCPINLYKISTAISQFFTLFTLAAHEMDTKEVFHTLGQVGWVVKCILTKAGYGYPPKAVIHWISVEMVWIRSCSLLPHSKLGLDIHLLIKHLGFTHKSHTCHTAKLCIHPCMSVSKGTFCGYQLQNWTDFHQQVAAF